MRIHMTGCLTAAAIAILLGGLNVTAQQSGETFTATATVKSPTASASAPVTIRVEKFVSDADRDRIMATIKAGDGAATRAALAAMPDIGFIELAKRRTPVKYAYARSTGGGRLLTVVTAQPILFLGGAAPDAKPKAGFDLALALLILDGNNTGDGELAPAVKLKMDNAGAIVTDEYGSEVIRLTGIAKAK
jgi:hypothetical protein